MASSSRAAQADPAPAPGKQASVSTIALVTWWKHTHRPDEPARYGMPASLFRDISPRLLEHIDRMRVVWDDPEMTAEGLLMLADKLRDQEDLAQPPPRRWMKLAGHTHNFLPPLDASSFRVDTLWRPPLSDPTVLPEILIPRQGGNNCAVDVCLVLAMGMGTGIIKADQISLAAFEDLPTPQKILRTIVARPRANTTPHQLDRLRNHLAQAVREALQVQSGIYISFMKAWIQSYTGFPSVTFHTLDCRYCSKCKRTFKPAAARDHVKREKCYLSVPDDLIQELDMGWASVEERLNRLFAPYVDLRALAVCFYCNGVCQVFEAVMDRLPPFLMLAESWATSQGWDHYPGTYDQQITLQYRNIENRQFRVVYAFVALVTNPRVMPASKTAAGGLNISGDHFVAHWRAPDGRLGDCDGRGAARTFVQAPTHSTQRLQREKPAVGGILLRQVSLPVETISEETQAGK